MIVREHGPLVWRIAWRLLRHDADASDCFQETFASAVRFAQDRPVTNWPGLLTRLATARALDVLRRRRREASRGGPEPNPAGVPSRIESPAAAAEADELAQRLRAALAELPDAQAEVFCLHCLDGLSHEEVAEQAGLKTGHVRVLLHRARHQLQQLLARERPQSLPEVPHAP